MRIIIGVYNVKIWAHNQDITEQMMEQFEAGEPNEDLFYDFEQRNTRNKRKKNREKKRIDSV